MSTAEPTCLRCGYDLRLAPADAACPECGLAVHRSIGERIHPDDCPPGWVRRIAIGSLTLLLSYVGLVLTIALVHGSNGVFGISPNNAMLIGLCWFGLMLVLHLTANVLLMANDPNRIENRRERWTRRAMLYAVAPLLWAMFGLWYFHARHWNPNSGIESSLKYFPITFVALPAFTFERLRQLASRLSRPNLAEHIRIVAVGMGSGAALTIVCCATLFDSQSQWSLLTIATAMAICMMFVIWGIALLFFITPKFFASARAATLKWQLADASQPAIA